MHSPKLSPGGSVSFYFFGSLEFSSFLFYIYISLIVCGTSRAILWVQCTGISLHTKLKCLCSLAHLYKMLVLSAWTLHILYNNVYKHFLLIYWAQLKVLQMLPRHDWKSTKMVTLHTREKQPFSNRLCLSTLQFFFWQGIDKAIELRQISFVELTLRNCRTEQQMMTAGGSRNVAVFCAAWNTK